MYVWILGERALSSHSFLLPIIVDDGGSRGIVRTDSMPKPGVSCTCVTLEGKGNANVDVEVNRGSSPRNICTESRRTYYARTRS